LENFLSRNRPSEVIKVQVDSGYMIKNQSIVIFKIRPQWNKPKIIPEHPLVKATYVKVKNNWKVFWRKSDL